MEFRSNLGKLDGLLRQADVNSRWTPTLMQSAAACPIRAATTLADRIGFRIATRTPSRLEVLIASHDYLDSGHCAGALDSFCIFAGDRDAGTQSILAVFEGYPWRGFEERGNGSRRWDARVGWRGQLGRSACHLDATVSFVQSVGPIGPRDEVARLSRQGSGKRQVI